MTLPNRIIMIMLAVIFILLIIYGAVTLRENQMCMMQPGIETEYDDSIYDAEAASLWQSI